MKKQKKPYLFNEFFNSGGEEFISPFLCPKAKKWGSYLLLKVSIVAAILLFIAFITSFISKDLSTFLLIIIYFLVGTPALLDTIKDLRSLEINIDVLMTLAALLSVLIGSEMEGALLLVLFSLSEAIEETVSSKTKSAIQSLRKLAPTKVITINKQKELYEKSITEVELGEHILIKAGEVIPLDGVIVEGSSYINLVHLTGENIPVVKKPNDVVEAGSRNLDGSLTIKVLKQSHESTLEKIATLIQQAQLAKPKLERFLDRFGKIYATTVIILFIFFALTMPLYTSLPFLGVGGSFYRALAFLIAASPCALIIATPTAYLSAISACAKKGILLKGGMLLDAIASSDLVALDKTGTLTQGKLELTTIDCFNTTKPICSEKEAISIAASLERGVLHPIADSLEKYISRHKIPVVPVQKFKATPGYGLEGIVNLNEKEIPVYIGSFEYIRLKLGKEFLAENWPTLQKEIENKEQLLAFLVIGTTLYLFHFTDNLRPDMPRMIHQLHKELSLDTIMLTGDHKWSADKIAKQIEIKKYYYDLKPEDKLNLIANLSKRYKLIMIGDGINDAPSLMRAHVGISMGKIGSATAIEASDVIFLHDNLSHVTWLIRKARQTKRILFQNITVALFVIVLATTPALLGLVPLWAAVILHEGGTVLVGLNSLRLLK